MLRLMGGNFFRVIKDVLPGERWLIIAVHPSSQYTLKIGDKAFLEGKTDRTSCESIAIALSSLGRGVEFLFRSPLLARRISEFPSVPYVKRKQLNNVQINPQIRKHKTWGYQWITDATFETLKPLAIEIRNLTSSFS